MTPELLYQDDRVVVCLKPPGVVSTDQPGGLPDLVRQALGEPEATVRTVHRLDQTVGGVMVLARTARAAADLSGQIRSGLFEKEYLAVLRGAPPGPSGTLTDLLLRDRRARTTQVVNHPGKDVQEAVLDYRVLARQAELSLVRIHLRTGRTHQIRVQFSSRGFPLVGDRKYGPGGEDCPIALWSYALAFFHPRSGQPLSFRHSPPNRYPWVLFSQQLESPEA